MKKSQMRDKTLSVKVPEDVADDIEYIKEMLTEIDPSKKFNINAICLDAVRKAIKKAKKELSLLVDEDTEDTPQKDGGSS